MIAGVMESQVRASTIRSVIFDVGGPLDLETAFEAAIDADILDDLRREGFHVTDAEWNAAHSHSVEVFAPSIYRAILWRLTGGNSEAAQRVYGWVEDRAHDRDLFELRPGIAQALDALRQRGLILGLCANQPVAVLERLRRAGIGQYFQNDGLSDVLGYRKPDIRLFLRVCADLKVEPTECIMVGDRIDNDIVPAKLLGMRTVLIRSGRHAEQQPRSWDEEPDGEATDAAGILDSIEQLLAGK
jgi:putative hydrolase of the HAD superfamily